MFSLLGLVTGELELDMYNLGAEAEDLSSQGSLSSCSSDYSSSLISDLEGFSLGHYKVESIFGDSAEESNSSSESVDGEPVVYHVFR